MLRSWISTCRVQLRGGQNADLRSPVVVTCHKYNLDTTLEKLRAEGFELVIVDTAGKIGTAERQALAACDLTLVPTAPSIVDLKASLPTARALSDLGKSFAYVLTKCPVGDSRLSEAQALIDKFGGRAGEPLRFRVDFQDALTRGLGVAENQISVVSARTSIRRRIWTDAWLAIGEAARTVDPMSGGGVARAIEDGREAAQAVAQAVAHEDGQALRSFALRKIEAFANDEAKRQTYYGFEKRWPTAPF